LCVLERIYELARESGCLIVVSDAEVQSNFINDDFLIGRALTSYKLMIFKAKVAKLSKDRYGIYLPREAKELHGREVIVHLYYKE